MPKVPIAKDTKFAVVKNQIGMSDYIPRVYAEG
jgi:hypothetical protein